MLHNFFVVAAFLLLTFSSNSQISPVFYTAFIDSALKAPEESPKKRPTLTVNGFYDGYYKYDFAETTANSLTSFTQSHNGFSLGMASIKLEYQADKVHTVADLGFGPRAKDFAYNDDGITQAIKQLYISYAPLKWLTITFGSWATHVGYELVDPQLNRNYSMSYLFTNGPFSHTGLKVEVSKGKHGFMTGISNATDYRILPKNQLNKKSLLAQYSVSISEKVKAFLNYVGGKNPDTSITSQFDAVLTANFNDKFNIGFNGTVNSTRLWNGIKNMKSKFWWGTAIYANFDPKDWLGITLRSELFSDKHQLKVFSGSAVGGKIFANTISANIKSGNFILIPECRIDTENNRNLFIDKKGRFRKSATSFIIAAIYSF